MRNEVDSTSDAGGNRSFRVGDSSVVSIRSRVAPPPPPPIPRASLRSRARASSVPASDAATGELRRRRRRGSARAEYLGRWICGLCAEAVGDEIRRAGAGEITTAEALDRHVAFARAAPRGRGGRPRTTSWPPSRACCAAASTRCRRLPLRSRARASSVPARLLRSRALPSRCSSRTTTRMLVGMSGGGSAVPLLGRLLAHLVQNFTTHSKRCPGNNGINVRRDRSGSGVQLGLQSPLAQQLLPGPTYLQRSLRPVQTRIAPTATRAR